jgi:hypothetical protein
MGFLTVLRNQTSGSPPLDLSLFLASLDDVLDRIQYDIEEVFRASLIANIDRRMEYFNSMEEAFQTGVMKAKEARKDVLGDSTWPAAGNWYHGAVPSPEAIQSWKDYCATISQHIIDPTETQVIEYIGWLDGKIRG